MDETFRTRAAAGFAGISETYIRSLSGEGGELAGLLSPGGAAPRGMTREFTRYDMELMATAAALRSAGLDYDSIRERLAEGERIAPEPLADKLADATPGDLSALVRDAIASRAARISELEASLASQAAALEAARIGRAEAMTELRIVSELAAADPALLLQWLASRPAASE